MKYKYMIMHRGEMAYRHMTKIGALKHRAKLLVEKGWAEIDVKVVQACPTDNHGKKSNEN